MTTNTQKPVKQPTILRLPILAKLKCHGMPVLTDPPCYGAVWEQDTIEPVRRHGSHWRCRVTFGPSGARTIMYALIPKRCLRIIHTVHVFPEQSCLPCKKNLAFHQEKEQN